MAPTPKKKHTRSRSNQRRYAFEKKVAMPNLVACPKCKRLKLPHHACPYCGFYR